jgi:TonB family protein
MNRLQKKCLFVAAGAHFLAVVVLLCSGFVRSRPKPDDSTVLTMIPANIIDAAFRSGVRDAQPPPPAPAPTPVIQPPPTPQQPTPEPPKPPTPVVHQEPPPPEPKEPDITKPIERPEPKPPKPHEIKVDLNKKVTRTVPKETDNSEAEARAEKAEADRLNKERQRQHDKLVKAFTSAARSIKSSTSSSTEVEMPGDSTQAYADYASVVKTVYTDAWRLPDNAANDEANVKVSITIARSGRVTDAHIIEKSGDPSLDNSVQRTLDRVSEIEPFPDGSTDTERTYVINFNLKAKRQLLE